MYFDFEDYRPDITPVGSVISWREGVLLSIIVHLLGVIVILVLPKYFPVDEEAALRRQEELMARIEERNRASDRTRFVFVQPRIDTPSPTPPPQADLSDQNRVARAPERAEQPTSPLPFSRGNSPERVEQATPDMARGRGPDPEPAAGPPQPPAAPPVAENELSGLRLPEAPSPLQLPSARPPSPPQGAQGRSPVAGGGLGEALRNLSRYVERDQFRNQRGGGGTFGPAIQFDTKGVEFGPWVRRFIAQVKRNWEPLIPLSAMTQSGHTIVTFNVHKDGSLTDIAVVGPSPINAFNTAAYGALASSNPTLPLPPEYPADRAFFTVTFFYNEEPQ
jgi:TonB family protein